MRPSHDDRIDMDRVVPATKEDSGERKAAVAAHQARVEADAKRKAKDQADLEAYYRQREEALKAELGRKTMALSEAADREVSLEDRNKRASFANTVVTGTIAAISALVAVVAWGYTQLREAGAEAEREKQRSERVDKALADDQVRFDKAERKIDDIDEALEEHTVAQEKVNTVQMLRAQRIDIMVETLLKREGKKPPRGSSKAIKDAEKAAGLPSIDPE